MNRRNFIKRGALFVPTIFVPQLIRAVSPIANPGFYNKPAPAAGGGGGCTPSYANVGGTGDRTAIITVTDSTAGSAGGVFHQTNGGRLLVNGTNGSGDSNWFTAGALSSSVWVKYGFSTPVLLTEAKFLQQDSTGQGVWQWHGSNDNSIWTAIGGSFNLVTAATTTLTTLNGNTTSYLWYRKTGVSGSTSSGPFIFEMQFQICGL